MEEAVTLRTINGECKRKKFSGDLTTGLGFDPETKISKQRKSWEQRMQEEMVTK